MYSYSPNRIYTPPDALLSEYRTMLRTLGVTRAVLVQPSVYASDMTVLLSALKDAGSEFRGVAVVDPAISDDELEQMSIAGVRGVRINIVDVKAGSAAFDFQGLRLLAERIRPLGWHMEFLLHVDTLPDLATTFENFPVDIVFGHLGYTAPGTTTDNKGFRDLLRLLRNGNTWVKLTGPYRISREQLPYPDVVALAHALVNANSDRIVWGTDWPHVMVRGAMPNDGDLCDLLSAWIPNEATREKILCTNPARLYGFD
ncbi:4-sulfomuconolactone hydrolase [Variibacter gotjawalensis]|uniref:4-sulfomuconolactone hydrolase n=1 Tax=Variibacter gotjawalensis TaxID=1333996 RepID=A0A0S3PRN3_9BRAD|nr:4-sulfomuconolactone hydrolase [Variibacter gotjawalensis]